MPSQSQRYDAFISYSHAADGKLAPAIQAQLHRLAKPWYRLRAMRVFRDQTDLSATPEAWSTIEVSLDHSDYLILMASPQAAKSKWIKREVDHWIKANRANKLFIVLTDGEIVWNENRGDFNWQLTTALPRNLAGVFENEPLWVDLRWAHLQSHLSSRHPDFVKAVARLAAPIREMEVDALVSADHREHKRILRLAWSTGFMLVLLTVLAIGAAIRANNDRRRAEAATEAERKARSRAEAAAEAERKARSLAEKRLAESVFLQGEAYREGKQWLKARDSYSKALSLYRKLGISTLPVEAGSWDTYRKAPQAIISFDVPGKELICAAVSQDNRLLILGVEDPPPDLIEETLRKKTTLIETLMQHAADKAKNPLAIIFDLPTGRELARFKGLHSGVTSCIFSPDRSVAVLGFVDGSIRVWELTTGRVQSPPSIHESQEVRCLSFSHDGSVLLSGANDGKIVVWNTKTWRPTHQLIDHKRAVNDIVFTEGDEYVLSGSEDTTVKLWNTATWSCANTFIDPGHTHPIRHVAIENNLAYLGTGLGIFSNLDWRKGVLWNRLSIASASGDSAVDRPSYEAVSSEGLAARFLGSEGGVKLWNISRYHQLGTFLGWELMMAELMFSKDGRILVTVTNTGKVTVWPVSYSQEGTPIEEPTEMRASLSTDGLLAASPNAGSNDVVLWDVATGREIKRFKGHVHPVQCVAFSPDGRRVLSGDGPFLPSATALGCTVRLWNVVTGKELYRLEGHSREIKCVAFDPNGERVLSGSGDGTVKLWDLVARKQVWSKRPHRFLLTGVALSRDGRFAASGGYDSKICLLDASTGDMLRSLSTDSPVHNLMFLPDSKRILFNDDKQVKLWWHETDQNSLSFTGPQISMAISSGLALCTEGMLAFSVDSEAVRVWDIESGREVCALSVLGTMPNSVAVSQNGSLVLPGTVVPGGDDAADRLSVWDISRSQKFREIEVSVLNAQQALRKDIDDIESLKVIGQWYALRGMWDWAIDMFMRVEKNGGDISGLLLARCYLQTGNMSAARQQYEIAKKRKEAPDYYLDLFISSDPFEQNKDVTIIRADDS